jgi:hypothetical protein
MNIEALQEEFSYAYVHAIAAAAGYSCAPATRLIDLSGVDTTIAYPGILGTRRNPKIDLQIKCCLQERIISEEYINYPLETKAYNKLIFPDPTCPYYLVIVTIPRNISDWVAHSEENLILRKCGYWHSLLGLPETKNKQTKTVKIPRNQQFSPDVLENLMLHSNSMEGG